MIRERSLFDYHFCVCRPEKKVYAKCRTKGGCYRRGTVKRFDEHNDSYTVMFDEDTPPQTGAVEDKSSDREQRQHVG
jgi:hypothetical protein